MSERDVQAGRLTAKQIEDNYFDLNPPLTEMQAQHRRPPPLPKQQSKGVIKHG